MLPNTDECLLYLIVCPQSKSHWVIDTGEIWSTERPVSSMSHLRGAGRLGGEDVPNVL
jgi:hypothetical protein